MNANDYLDGRMDAAERQHFEERLKSDPTLAAELERGLELRAALRTDAEPLPEAFYTRTRAEFEAQQKRPSRWVGWAGLGIATSAALAFVLLRPVAPTTPAALDEIASEPPPVAERQAAPSTPEELTSLSTSPAVPAPTSAATETATEKKKERSPAVASEVLEDRAQSDSDLSANRSILQKASAPPPSYDDAPAEPLQRRIAYAVGGARLNSQPQRRERNVAGLEAEIATRSYPLEATSGVAACEQIQATLIDGAWQIEIVRPADGERSNCAIDLPADGFPVFFKGKRIDE